jgi:hypothetical protein
MKTLAQIARSVHAEALAYKPSEGGDYSFYCCNHLMRASIEAGLRGWQRDEAENLFKEYFGDADFWVGFHEEEYRAKPNWIEYPAAARHADRIDALDLFATILESGDD